MLICMQGLPASGKTTRANELIVEKDAVLIETDYLNNMLHGIRPWKASRQAITREIVFSIVSKLLEADNNVIIDDLNLDPTTLSVWEYFARRFSRPFLIERMDTDFYVCIDRNTARGCPIGNHVIHELALQYGLYPIPSGGLVLCDLDGTLSDFRHRLHFIEEENKDWNSFFDQMIFDRVRKDVNLMLNDASHAGCKIILVTGRPDKYRKDTEAWLLANKVSYDTLLMSFEGMTNSDFEFKKYILDTYFPNKNSINLCIDDNPSVIEIFRSHGLNVFEI